ncbi:hypothetical protein GBA52_001769 [Prunus armeniaca]|nr:hypothetical protein GBA52_001769 [Prunus armeniaca]
MKSKGRANGNNSNAALKTSMLKPVTSVVFVLGFLVTLTNSVKPTFTGTPILNFLPSVGTSHPLGTESESPGHMTSPRTLELKLDDEFKMFTSPFWGIQNQIVLAPPPFILTNRKVDD